MTVRSGHPFFVFMLLFLSLRRSRWFSPAHVQKWFSLMSHKISWCSVHSPAAPPIYQKGSCLLFSCPVRRSLQPPLSVPICDAPRLFLLPCPLRMQTWQKHSYYFFVIVILLTEPLRSVHRPRQWLVWKQGHAQLPHAVADRRRGCWAYCLAYPPVPASALLLS